MGVNGSCGAFGQDSLERRFGNVGGAIPVTPNEQAGDIVEHTEIKSFGSSNKIRVMDEKIQSQRGGGGITWFLSGKFSPCCSPTLREEIPDILGGTSAFVKLKIGLFIVTSRKILY
jgi:hypothetical protein